MATRTEKLDTLHISELAKMLGVPDISRVGDSFHLAYLAHQPSQSALVLFAIEPDRYSLTVNVADGHDDADQWAAICLAIVYAIQNKITCKLEDCGQTTTVEAD